MHPLIGTGELAAQPDRLLVFDCRAQPGDPGKGQRDYLAGHIPGAVHADLDLDLSSPPGERGRHPLPEREHLTRRFRTWGVNRDSALVCYDQNTGALAARFWWLARWLGHSNVRVLDGGLDAWINAGQDTETAPQERTSGDFTAGEPLTRVCEVSEVQGQGHTLLDARDAARYRGEVEPLDKVAGHIPGALCVPFPENLMNDQFRSSGELAGRFTDLGLTPEHSLVCYCGSGVTATHNILALLIAGYPEPALYPGSWSEWISDPNRPIETGN